MIDASKLPPITLPALNPLTTPIDPMGIWGLTMFFGMIICVVLLMRKYLPYIGWAPALLWGYALSNALFVLEFPDTPFGDYNRAFEATAGRSFAEMLLIPLAAAAAPKLAWKIIPWLVLFDIGLVWFDHSAFTPWDSVSTSFDTATMALFIPFSPVWLWPLSLLTIVTHHGSTALLILFAELLAWNYVKARPWPLGKKVRAWIGFLVMGSALISIAYYHSNSAWFDSSERLHNYARFMEFPNRLWNFKVFGVGANSFMWVSLMMDNFGSTNWVWMLSDWLQITFEFGRVGLALALATFVTAIWNVRRNAQLLAAVLGCGSFMLTYHPCHFFPTMFLFALIGNEAICKVKL